MTFVVADVELVLSCAGIKPGESAANPTMENAIAIQDKLQDKKDLMFEPHGIAALYCGFL